MTDELLHNLRRWELESIRSQIAPGFRVLEIGGGDGFQANLLASFGCAVLSIDVAPRSNGESYYPVQQYDGKHIPAEDKSFNVVFSSHVLEHIKFLPTCLEEIRRVLKPRGLAIHVLPSSAWRFWTSLAHYPFLLLHALGLHRAVPGVAELPTLSEVTGKLGLRHTAKRILLAGPHGEYASAFAELYYFSKRRWMRVFNRHGFRVERTEGNGLFYTGYGLFPNAPLATRQALARWLGSAAHVFFTRHSSVD
jgi:SAM-dependent methyltransferase